MGMGYEYDTERHDACRDVTGQAEFGLIACRIYRPAIEVYCGVMWNKNIFKTRDQWLIQGGIRPLTVLRMFLLGRFLPYKTRVVHYVRLR